MGDSIQDYHHLTKESSQSCDHVLAGLSPSIYLDDVLLHDTLKRFSSINECLSDISF